MAKIILALLEENPQPCYGDGSFLFQNGGGMKDSLQEISTVSLEDWRTANQSTRARFVKTVSAAFRDIGFVFIHAPEVTALLPKVYRQFRNVFDLPENVKAKYEHVEIAHQRGWTPPFTEKAIACRKMGPDKTDLADAKENWFMGPDVEEGHPLQQKFPTLYPANIWPEEVPEFRAEMYTLYDTLFNIGKEVLRAVAESINKPQDFFDEMIRESPTVMRAIHYPPVTEEEVGKIVWACKHMDINLFTVLPASTKKGLWIRTRKAMWIPGSAPPDCVIMQVGDMLDYLTGGYFMSAPHEVRAPGEPTTEGRLSAALFIHARSDFTFDPSSIDPEFRGVRSDRLKPIIAGELLLKRLKAIGLAY